MEPRFHKRVQFDVNSILEDYYSVSDDLADDFYEEFMHGVSKAVANPRFFHFDSNGLRRCNLRRFPFPFLYDIRSKEIRVWVLRHNRRKPSFGIGRFDRSS